MRKTGEARRSDPGLRYTKRTLRFRHLVMLTALIALHSLTVQAWSQETKLTLRDAIAIALEKNYDVRAMRNSMLAQKQDIGIARSFLLPQITLEGRFTRTNNPPGVFMAKLNQERFSSADFAIQSLNHPDPVTDFQSIATVEQTLFSGRALLGWTMAKKDFSAKEQEYGRSKEETVLAVVRTYLQVGTAREYLSVAKAGVTDAAEHVRIAEARERNGVGLYSDVLRAKTAFTLAEQMLVTAEKNLILARKGLGLVLGNPDPFDVAGERVQFPLRNIEFYSTAAKSRKDVKAMELRYENAGSSVTLAASRYLPIVGMRAGYQLNDHKAVFGSEGESWWLMGILRWDLFDGAGREYEYSKARYKRAEAGEQLAGLRSMVEFKITEAYLAVEEVGKIRDLARSAIATAEEGRKLVKSRYTNSLSPLVDLLDAQLSLDTARANLVATEKEYQLAIVRLNYESGTIMETLEVKQAMGRGNYDER